MKKVWNDAKLEGEKVTVWFKKGGKYMFYVDNGIPLCELKLEINNFFDAIMVHINVALFLHLFFLDNY